MGRLVAEKNHKRNHQIQDDMIPFMGFGLIATIEPVLTHEHHHSGACFFPLKFATNGENLQDSRWVDNREIKI